MTSEYLLWCPIQL